GRPAWRRRSRSRSRARTGPTPRTSRRSGARRGRERRAGNDRSWPAQYTVRRLRSPSPGAEEDAVILAGRVQVVDAQRRPVEAGRQLGERRGLDRLVDLDRAQEAMVSEARGEHVDDLDDRRRGAPPIE